MAQRELRLHLEERLDELTDRGVDPKKAVNIALCEFGDATALANKFTEISRMKRRKVMMRSMVGGLCAAVVAFAALMTIWPQSETNFMGIAHAEPTAKEADDDSASLIQANRDNQETREKLKKKIDADFIERPFNELIMEMKKLTDVQFYVDFKSLEQLGLSCDMPISFQLKNVPAELVLRLIFNQLKLSYYVDSGVVIVTSEEAMAQNLSVSMYNVKDLVGEGGHATLVPAGVFSGGDMGPNVSQSYINAIHLGYMIQEFVDPKSWKMGANSAHGTLSIYRGILIVRQTEAVHEEIGKLLDQLRDKLQQSPSETPAVPIWVPEPQPNPGRSMPMGGGMMGMPGEGKPGMTGMLGMPPGGMRTGDAAPPKEAKPEKEK